MVSIFLLIVLLVSFWSVRCYDFSFWLSFVMISFDASSLQDDYFDLFSFIIYIFLIFNLLEGNESQEKNYYQGRNVN